MGLGAGSLFCSVALAGSAIILFRKREMIVCFNSIMAVMWVSFLCLLGWTVVYDCGITCLYSLKNRDIDSDILQKDTFSSDGFTIDVDRRIEFPIFFCILSGRS